MPGSPRQECHHPFFNLSIKQRMRRFINIFSLLGAATLTLGSCNAIMDKDLEPCTTTVRVHLKYDYNIPRADMFSDHVGEVRLFVVDDKTGTVVRDTIVSNRDNFNAIKSHSESQTFHIDFKDLPDGGTYRFVAYAQQRPYDETIQHPEDKFVITSPQVATAVTTLESRLTRNATVDALNRHAVTAPACGLDTLWMGHTTRPITLPQQRVKMVVIDDTVSMVRDTKYLTLRLHNLDEAKKADIYAQDFTIEITDNNGLLGWNNNLLTDKDKDMLLYSPHDQRTGEYLGRTPESPDADVVVEREAQYDISFSRLMFHTGTLADRNARLIIRRNSDGMVIANLNLPFYLAMGRDAFAIYHYSEQEYLDREYDYDMDLYLRGDTWDSGRININITAWAIRFQNEKL